MADIGAEFVVAAHDLIGRPFKQHYAKFTPCSNGVLTDPTCMERGLDIHNEGLDCTGLVIVSMCRVLHLPITKWPVDFRHTDQLDTLAVARAPRPHDVVVFNRHGFRAVHVGILLDDGRILHATDEHGDSVRIDPLPLKEDDEYISPEVLASVPDLATLANNR